MRRTTLVLLVSVVALALPPVAPAWAATFTVDVFADDPAATCAGGPCSLRGALAAARLAPGSDVVVVPAGVYAVDAPLDVHGDVVIAGAGAAATILDGEEDRRVLNVWSGTVTVRDLTIMDGRDNGEQGGGVYVVGGATMVGEDLIVQGNAATLSGGGFLVQGVLELTDSAVADNASGGSGGGIAVVPGGSATLTGTTVSDNTAAVYGGGISAFTSDVLALTRSQVTRNTATDLGGGIWTSAPTTVDQSWLDDNHGSRGGGLFAEKVPSLTVSDSTLTGNDATAVGGNGGGIAAVQPGSLDIVNSTLSGNTAAGEGGAIELSDLPATPAVTISRSTLAGNSAVAVPGQLRIAGAAGSYELHLEGVVVQGEQLCSNANVVDSLGDNVIQDVGPCPFVAGATPDLLGADPLLAPLADNGGPTRTHALLAGSPAVDLGGDCRGDHPSDQRGLPRDSRCDSGAYEVQPPPPPPPPVDNAPIAEAGGPYAATVGHPVTLDAAASRDPDGDALSFAWDLDGDGGFEDAEGPNPEVTFDASGKLTVTVRVTARGRSITDAATVVVDVPATELRDPGQRLRDASEVALAWSRLAFPATGTDADVGAFALAPTRPDTVLLGRADVFADSLASGGAQGVLGAPLLLTRSDALERRVADELVRLGPDRVILLGGEEALAPAVAAAVADLGPDVERVAGPTRVETAAALADHLGPASRVVLARAGATSPDDTQAFADALAAGALAAVLGVPLLLTQSDRLSPATADAMTATGAGEVLVVGGTDAIADAVTDDLRAMGLDVQRLSGDERAGTAVALAAARGADTAAAADGVILIDGQAADAWVDAFPAALSSARLDAPVVLAAATALPRATTRWLDGGGVPLLCGARTASAACAAAVGALRSG